MADKVLPQRVSVTSAWGTELSCCRGWGSPKREDLPEFPPAHWEFLFNPKPAWNVSVSPSGMAGEGWTLSKRGAGMGWDGDLRRSLRVPLEIPGFRSMQECCWEQRQAPDWFGQSFAGLQAGFKIKIGYCTCHLVSLGC